MLARATMLAVPSLAMAVVGFALFGPGSVRSFDAAQIWGGPTEGARLLSWRILGVERFRGIDSTKKLGVVLVIARLRDGSEARAFCRTGSDGVCEVALPLAGPTSGPVHAEVRTEDGRTTLASGDFARSTEEWSARPEHPARIVGSSRGDLSIEVRARRGIFAAPFRDELLVSVKRAGSPAGGAKVTLQTEGADVDGAVDASATHTTSDEGEAVFTVTPRTHTVDVTIEASAAGLTGSWDGVLPVIPGAMWSNPEGTRPGSAHRKIYVYSPVPRDVAYATLANRSYRLWGGVIPLTHDGSSWATGAIDWPLSAEDSGPMWLTLASDPRATGGGTVGWPIVSLWRRAEKRGHFTIDTPATPELAFRDWLLLDGMPAADRRDADRRGRARRLAATALGAAAAIEGVLLARSSIGKGARSWAWLVVAVGTVALAFAALGLVAMWQTG